MEPLSGYVALAMALHDDAALHGEPFNFGPPAHQDHSVGELVGAIAGHWNRAGWESASTADQGPHESGLLKLNCDKALHHLNWRAAWDFAATVRETALWYRRFYENQTPQESMREMSLQQITRYVDNARKQGLTWAQ
jgi:CDP-glucose 4,6-dehydratase